MHRHWNLFIKPALDNIQLDVIVEIGADKGQNTNNLLKYCIERNAKLISIDCVPSKELLSLFDEYNDIFILYDKPSLEVLSELPPYDAIIIDGDHNWYTVYNELQIIKMNYKKLENFP